MLNHLFQIGRGRFFPAAVLAGAFLAAGLAVRSEEASQSQESRDAPLKTPKLITAPGPQYADENRDFNMNCGIAQTPGGRLWACWISGGDSDDAYLVAARSDDDGQTWSAPCLAVDPEEAPDGTKVRSLIGNFWTDPKGCLWLFFDVGLGMFDGRVGLWAVRCDQPDAADPIWTEPVRIYHGSLHNKLLVTKEGSWLLPAELYQKDYVHYNVYIIHPKHDFFPEADECRGVTILESKDRGETWNPIGRVLFPVSGGEEPILIDRPDGSLRLFARTPKGIHEAVSADGGKTWSEPVPSFNNPVTRFLIMRLASGKLLFVRHGIDGEVKGRDQLRAWISDDEGKSWQGGMFIDERPNVAYPDGFQAKDGRIYVTYEHGRGEEAEILMAVFTEEDVLAGQPVTEAARMKRLVNKGMKKNR